MPRIKRIITLAAISAATAASAPGIAGAAPSTGSGSGSGHTPNPGVIAAERAQSAPLDRFALINERDITPSTSSGVRPNPDEQLPATPPAVAATDKAAIARDRLGDRVLSGNLLRTAPISGHSVASPATPVVSTTQGSPGFQYDDAAIGAGVMVGFVLLGTAGMVAVRRRGQLRHT